VQLSNLAAAEAVKVVLAELAVAVVLAVLEDRDIHTPLPDTNVIQVVVKVMLVIATILAD